MNRTEHNDGGGEWLLAWGFFCQRSIAIGFLLFCFTIYWAAALRGFFFQVPSFAWLSSTVPLVVLASLGLSLSLQLGFKRLWFLFLLASFISLAIWVSGAHGHWVVLLSVWLLAGAIGLVIAAGLHSRQEGISSLRVKWLLLRVTCCLLSWVCIELAFLELRAVIGWLLAIRVMLLLPVVLALFSLHQPKEKRLQPIKLCFAGAKKLLPQSVLLGGVLLVVLALVAGYLTQMQASMTTWAGGAALLAVATFTFLPIPKRHAHYLLSVSALALLLASLVCHAQSFTVDLSAWVLMALLTGLGLGGFLQAMQGKLHHQSTIKAQQELVLTTMLALAILVFYPVVVHFVAFMGCDLLTPLLLLFALLATFFAAK